MGMTQPEARHADSRVASLAYGIGRGEGTRAPGWACRTQGSSTTWRIAVQRWGETAAQLVWLLAPRLPEVNRPGQKDA
jgi:hypothetical protein